MALRATYMSRTSSSVISTTNKPRLGIDTSRPSWVRRCIPSRRGPLLTPSWRARSASPSCVPAGSSPSRIASRSLAAMMLGVDSRTTGSKWWRVTIAPIGDADIARSSPEQRAEPVEVRHVCDEVEALPHRHLVCGEDDLSSGTFEVVEPGERMHCRVGDEYGFRVGYVGGLDHRDHGIFAERADLGGGDDVVAAHREHIGATLADEVDEVRCDVLRVRGRDGDAAQTEVAYRIDERERRRGDRYAQLGGDAVDLFAGAVPADYEAARRRRPQDRNGPVVAQGTGPRGETRPAAEIEQGIDPMGVLADRCVYERQPDCTVETLLQRRVIVLGTVAGVEKADRGSTRHVFS